MDALQERLEKERPALEMYERVHAELEMGKTFESIDLSPMKSNPFSYEGWLAYMQQHFINAMRDLLHISDPNK